MIYADRKITITKDKASIDAPIILYRGDRQVEIRFTILSQPFKFRNQVDENVIESSQASYGQLVVRVPNDKPPIFSEVSAVENGMITFVITKEMIDEIEEVGYHDIQIRLLDESKQSRASIPPVANCIQIREPIAIEDNLPITPVLPEEELPIFNEDGSYNETLWTKNSEVTVGKMNKIEGALSSLTTTSNSNSVGITKNTEDIQELQSDVTSQGNELITLQNTTTTQGRNIIQVQSKNTEQDATLETHGRDISVNSSRLDSLKDRVTETENVNNTQNERLDTITSNINLHTEIITSMSGIVEGHNTRLQDVENKNAVQDANIRCLYESSNNTSVEHYGNDVTLQNVKEGTATVEYMKGETFVNCNKESDKELILSPQFDSSAANHLTITEARDGSKADVYLEGNTMVNVCDQKDPVAITKGYTVETGNHVALQGEYDGKCRPVVTGNTLVNIANIKNKIFHWGDSELLQYPKSNTTYTFIVNITNPSGDSTYNMGIINESKDKWCCHTLDISSGYSVFTLTTNDLSPSNILRYGANKADVTATFDIIILEGDYTDKPIPDYFEGLQSSFEDKVVTQEMVDAGEELADNLGKYKVDYVISREDGTVGFTKTFYLNSPLLEGDIIEQQGNNVVHVHRYKEVVFDGSADEGWGDRGTGNLDGSVWHRYSIKINDMKNLSENIICDKLSYAPYDTETIGWQTGSGQSFIIQNKLSAYATQDVAGFKQYLQQNPITVVYQLATPQYEVISQNDTILCDSYVNGHLDVDSVVPIKRVNFMPTQLSPLKYVYKKTKYTLQFESDNVGKIDYLMMGQETKVNIDVIKGLNKINITTASTSPYLDFRGIGFNASNIVVTEATDQDFGYFEGMKSVGECEGNMIEILSHNKNILNIKEAFTCVIGNWGMSVLNNRNPISGTMNIEGNTITVSGNTSYHFLVFPVDLKKYATYYLNYNCNQVLGNNISFFTDLNTTRVETKDVGNGAFILKQDCKYIGFPFNNKVSSYTLSNLYININENHGYVEPKSNSQQLTHEPLRGIGDYRDRYTLIDGKWYIERNCGEVVLDGVNNLCIGRNALDTDTTVKLFFSGQDIHARKAGHIISSNLPKGGSDAEHIALDGTSPYGNIRVALNKTKLDYSSLNSINSYLQSNNIRCVLELALPTYEPIDYNPFEVYSDITHISNNSTIPCNVTVKNHGFNCMLKPSTKYTLTYTKDTEYLKTQIVTPPTLDDSLRFYGAATMKDLLVLEGTPSIIPSNFSGIESAFEQEYDEEKGKYKVNVKVANEDKTQENNITFYINEPLRGIGDVKDILYADNHKVIVQRNCGSVTLDGSEDENLAKASTDYDSVNNISFTFNNINNISSAWTNPKAILSSRLPNVGYNVWEGRKEGITSDTKSIIICLNRAKLPTQNLASFKQWLQQNPTTVVYQLAEPTYEEVEYQDINIDVNVFPNAKIYYNSNLPVLSKVNYPFSVELKNTVDDLSNISDEQDQMIIDLAAQVAMMDMMLM